MVWRMFRPNVGARGRGGRGKEIAFWCLLWYLWVRRNGRSGDDGTHSRN